MTVLNIRGFELHKGFLTPGEQLEIVEELRSVIRDAPLFSPQTPYGKPMSVRMTSAGKFGWFSDKSGYRYVTEHPSGTPWPEIPACIRRVWMSLAANARMAECCLINFYDANAKMGLHQDKDEADFSQPVVSVSLGDSARFRIGNVTRGGSTESVWLDSGDVVLMAGDARMTYHGVDQIRFGSSSLLKRGGRINLTLRVVT